MSYSARADSLHAVASCGFANPAAQRGLHVSAHTLMLENPTGNPVSRSVVS